MTTLERAEAAEHALSQELDRTVVKSAIYTSGDRDPRLPVQRPDNGKYVMMGHDPRLPRMPEKPTLFDFYKYRFAPANHMMQSARLAIRTAPARRSSSPAWSTTSPSPGSSGAITATGRPSSSSRTSIRR